MAEHIDWDSMLAKVKLEDDMVGEIKPVLKHCPFCGSKNIDCSEAGLKTDVWFVQCFNCYATFPHFDSEAEAIEAWNRRA